MKSKQQLRLEATARILCYKDLITFFEDEKDVCDSAFFIRYFNKCIKQIENKIQKLRSEHKITIT